MSSRLFAILFPVAAALCATGALADEPCSGTLCDLYYGKSSSFEDEKPAVAKAPTPVMVPSGGILGMFSRGNATSEPSAPGQAAPAKRPLVGVGGGGLAAMARGEAPDECSGTLCDLYYGKSSSFEDEKHTAPAAAATQPSAEVAADTPAPAAPAEMAGFQTRPEPPRCAAKGRDPWSCYR